MATYSDSLGYAKGGGEVPAYGVYDITRAEVTLDFAKINAARAAAGATALAASDVIEALTIPAGVVVSCVTVMVVSADSSTATIAVGDGADPDGFATATAVATAGTVGTAGAYTLGGKVYAAEDTIDVTLGTAAPTAAVVRVRATFSRI